MKTIGIIGGLSPESTISYYQGLNDGVNQKLGGHHNAKIILSSVDFGIFVELKQKGDWETQEKLLCNEAQALERAGADFVILATNTMHKMADQIEASIDIPFLHIGNATAQAIKDHNIQTVGLLGTQYVMEMDFYKGRMERAGINVLVPDEAGRTEVNRIIYDELCQGIVTNEARKAYQQVIVDLSDNGVEGVIFGCTEIGLLLGSGDVHIPVFDTAQIHIDAALSLCFAD